jgi:hypothetical protein
MRASLQSHNEQAVSLRSFLSTALRAQSCVCACGAVSAIAWRTGCKSLLFPQGSTHCSLICVCAWHAALSLPSHGKQAVSLCSSRSAALTSRSCACVWHVALSLPSHGEQEVSLCSTHSSIHSSFVCVCAWHGAFSLSSHGEQRVSLCSSTAQHSQLTRVCMYMACDAVSAIVANRL